MYLERKMGFSGSRRAVCGHLPEWHKKYSNQDFSNAHLCSKRVRKESSWDTGQAVGGASLIAKTMEIKGRVRFPGRINKRHLRNQQRCGVLAECLCYSTTKDKFLGKIENTEPAVNIRWDHGIGEESPSHQDGLSSEPSNNLPRKHLEGTDFTATLQ